MSSYNVSALAANATAARFLTQTTWGTTTDTTENMTQRIIRSGTTDPDATDVFKEWMHEQMALPYTSHRAWLRQRQNQRSGPQRNGHVVGQSRSACAAGSRWHHFAFTTADLYRQLKIEEVSVGDIKKVIRICVRVPHPIRLFQPHAPANPTRP